MPPSSNYYQTLTHEFRGSEDIFEFNTSFDFVRQAKVYEFDVGQGDVPVQEHDVFRLEKETEETDLSQHLC